MPRSQSATKTPKPPKEDLRIFLRIDGDNPHRQKSPYAVRTAVAGLARIELTDLANPKRIKTGWSIRARTAEARDKIEAARAKLQAALGLNDVDRHSKWHNYIVGN